MQLKERVAHARLALRNAQQRVRQHASSHRVTPVSSQVVALSQHAASQPPPIASIDSEMYSTSLADLISERDMCLLLVNETQTRLDVNERVIAQERTDLLTNRMDVDATEDRRQLVTLLLVERCQVHSHSSCCTKYGPIECRFGYPQKVPIPVTSFDDNDVLRVRRSASSAWVNSYNTYVLNAMRCNMDIKLVLFTALGALLAYYLSKYISKAAAVQLAHDTALRSAGAIGRQVERAAPPTNGDFVPYARSALYRLLSSQSTISEVSSTAAAYTILNQVCSVTVFVMRVERADDDDVLCRLASCRKRFVVIAKVCRTRSLRQCHWHRYHCRCD